MEEADKLARLACIPAHDEATQAGEHIADVLHALGPAQRLARVGEQGERQDRARPRDGQWAEHRAELLFPGVGGPGLVKQFRVSLVHRTWQLGEVDRRIVQDGLGQQTGDEPVPAGPIENGRVCCVRDATARQITVEVGRGVVLWSSEYAGGHPGV